MDSFHETKLDYNSTHCKIFANLYIISIPAFRERIPIMP